MNEIRIQKLISGSGLCSRRKAEQLLNEKRVLVNGRTAKLGDKADRDCDLIVVDGVPLLGKTASKVIAINKPKGVICSCSDPQGRLTIIDLLPAEERKGLHPVGRLDKDSRGIILLTNNGELTLKLTHPRYSHCKTYMVLVEGKLSQESIEQWRKGIILNGRKTREAYVELTEQLNGRSLLKIILKEGRNRQIRRIAEILGHPVIDLQRISIEQITINGLSEGKWRILEEKEWTQLIKKGKMY